MNVDTLCVSCMEDDSGSPTCPKCGALFQLANTNLLLLPPRTLLHQQYVIGRALGHGGFGVTYLAWDTGLQIRLAIKEYMPSGVAGRSTPHTVHPCSERMKDEYEWGLDRFLEEARVLKKFSTHPNIVAVDTMFRDNGTAYMVMEYLEGVTFEEFLARRGGKVPFETALKIMVPIMDTLATVHAEGILHRDISPDNIHLGKNGKVKLMDFGAARNALSQKSRNLSVILKEGYAPEEQYRSSGIQGPWTDVYATAATLYHAITGKLPPPALDRAAEDNIESPSQLGVAIPPGSEKALLKALAVRAIDRFQCMEDFKSGLTGSVNAPPPVPVPAVQAAATQPPPIPQQRPAPPLVAAPVASQAPHPPPIPRNDSSPPPSGSSRKWLIPVTVLGIFGLAAGAAVTLKYGPDFLSKFSNKEESTTKGAPTPPPAPVASQPAPVASQPAPVASQPAPVASQKDEDRQPSLAQQTPPGGDPPGASAEAQSQPPAQAPEPPAPAPVRRADPAPAPAPARRVDSAPAPQPPVANPGIAARPLARPPVSPAARATSGVLRYVGRPVPFNGRVTFENLPGGRLKFTFDHEAWQPIISRQPDGSQTLILVSLKHDLQSTCEVQWERVP